MNDSTEPDTTLIGYLVWWDSENFEMKQDLFVKLLEETYPELSIGILNTDTLDVHAVLQIIQEINNNAKNGILIKKVAKKKGVYTFTLSDTNELRGSVKCPPDSILSVSSEGISCKGKHRAFDLIQAKLNENKNTIGSEAIDLLLTSLIDKCNKIVLCEKKKIFFVENDVTLSNVAALVTMLNENMICSNGNDTHEIKLTLLPQSPSSLLEIHNTFRIQLHKELALISEIQDTNDTLSDSVLLDTIKTLRRLVRIPEIFCIPRLDTLNNTLRNEINAVRESIENKFLDDA